MTQQSFYRILYKTKFAWLILVLSGCGTSPKTSFYHLEQTVSPQLTRLEGGITLGIGPVNIAPYLDRPQIVTRLSQHKLELSEFNRWAEPLKSNISRVIAVELSNLLVSNRVFILPRQNKDIPLDYRLSIEISRFDGQLGKDANLIARWSIYDNNKKAILTKISIINESFNGNGFEPLIDAENKTLQNLSHEIAGAIKESPLNNSRN